MDRNVAKKKEKEWQRDSASNKAAKQRNDERKPNK